MPNWCVVEQKLLSKVFPCEFNALNSVVSIELLHNKNQHPKCMPCIKLWGSDLYANKNKSISLKFIFGMRLSKELLDCLFWVCIFLNLGVEVGVNYIRHLMLISSCIWNTEICWFALLLYKSTYMYMYIYITIMVIHSRVIYLIIWHSHKDISVQKVFCLILSL